MRTAAIGLADAFRRGLRLVRRLPRAPCCPRRGFAASLASPFGVLDRCRGLRARHLAGDVAGGHSDAHAPPPAINIAVVGPVLRPHSVRRRCRSSRLLALAVRNVLLTPTPFLGNLFELREQRREAALFRIEEPPLVLHRLRLLRLRRRFPDQRRASGRWRRRTAACRAVRDPDAARRQARSNRAVRFAARGSPPACPRAPATSRPGADTSAPTARCPPAAVPAARRRRSRPRSASSGGVGEEFDHPGMRGCNWLRARTSVT